MNEDPQSEKPLGNQRTSVGLREREENAPLDQRGAEPLNEHEQEILDATKRDLEGDDTDEDSNKPRKPEQRDSEGAEADERASLYNPGGTGDTEAGGSENSLYAASVKKKGGQKKLLGFSKKKLGIAGTVVGTTVAGGVIGFILLLPLKLVSIVEGLQNKYFAGINSALDKRSEMVMSDYVKNHLLPGMNTHGCSSTRINRKCAVTDEGSGKISKLYRAWSDNNFEGKLADKYGLEFQNKGGNFSVLVAGRDSPIPLGADFMNGRQDLFSYIDNVDKPGGVNARTVVRKATEGETFFKRSIIRYKISSLLNRKYDQDPRCVVACDGKKSFKAWKNNKKKAAIFYIADKVVARRSQSLAIILECFATGGCQDPAGKAADGSKQDKFDQKVSQNLEKYGQLIGGDVGDKAVSQIIKRSEGILDKGIERYVLEEVLQQFVSKATAEGAGKAIPVIGWVDLADTVVTTASNTQGIMRKISYATNAAAMAQLYLLYRTNVDEIKAGKVDAGLVGSFTDTLGDINHSGSAENSPLYSDIFGTKPVSSPVASLFPSAYAADKEAPPSKYICNNGQPVPKGKLICPEDSLAGASLADEALGNIKDALAGIEAVLGIWHNKINTTGIGPESLKSAFTGLTSWTGALVAKVIDVVPPLAAARDYLLQNVAGPVLEKLQKVAVSYLVVSPFPDKLTKMGGAKTVTLMAGGANVTANYYAEYGLGGQKMTDKQVAEIDAEQLQNQKHEFAQKSFYARVFDTSDTMSLISRVALSMPTPNSVTTSIAGFIQNPFSTISSVFASVFHGPRAIADSPKPDPFGVTHYGYPLGSSALSSPISDDDEACKKQIADWEDSATVPEDSLNGQPEHTTTAPCKLDDAVIAGLGGAYDTSLLGDDYKASQPVVTTEAGN